MSDFEPSFTGTRQEKSFVLESLSEFIDDRLITDVLYRVKGGKEATVYCCAAGPEAGARYLAGKVFRPRMFRAMRNDARYKVGRGHTDAEGKTVLDTRALRAIAKKTEFGRFLDSASWCRHEYEALRVLFAAGAEVPCPVAVAPNAILMEFVGDEEGAAPVLSSLGLPREEAEEAFTRILRSVEVMLSRFLVHADLSAYNVLYHRGEIRLIDFPQCVDAQRHPEGWTLFARDIDRLCAYFGRRGIAVNATALAEDLWRRAFD